MCGFQFNIYLIKWIKIDRHLGLGSEQDFDTNTRIYTFWYYLCEAMMAAASNLLRLRNNS